MALGTGRSLNEEEDHMAESERCPVCGMQVDPESSPSESYDGTTYHFCSNDCRTAFQQEPQSYVPGQSM